jgi:hypothetical protein
VNCAVPMLVTAGLAFAAPAAIAVNGADPAASPCAPAPHILPFAPPQGQPLRLLVTTERPGRDAVLGRYTMEYRLLFRPEGRGQRLTATLVRLDLANASGAGGAIQAMLGPLAGRPVEYLVSGDGKSLLMQDSDQLWQDVTADIAASAARAPTAEARQVGAILTALPPAEREAMLSADIRQLLRFAGRDWTRSYAQAAGGGDADCTLLTLIEPVSAAAPPSGIATERRWQVDRATGLVRLQSEVRWPPSANGAAREPAVRTVRILSSET